jgi:PPM family protein phosphatase
MTKQNGTSLRGGSSTEVGRRQVNQDRVLLSNDNRLFAVADGMGGHRGGATAAELAVTELAQHQLTDTLSLRDAIISANRIVFERSQNDPELQGMGTTITAVALVEVDGEERIAIANVGDSRTYLLRNGELEQLTEDHTLVAELVRDGHLTADEAKTHKNRSVVTRAIGVEPDVDVDLLEVLPAAGDRYLLCSDGLTGDVGTALIAATLRRFADPGEASRDLVRVALANGSKDNISAVVVEVDSDGDLAIAASSALISTPMTSGGEADATTTTANTTAIPVSAKRLSGRADANPTNNRAASGRKRVITLRSVMFFALLGVIGGVAWWALTNAPKEVIIDPPTSVVVTTSGSTVAVPATTVAPSGPPSTLSLPSTSTPPSSPPTTQTPSATTSPKTEPLGTTLPSPTVRFDSAPR